MKRLSIIGVILGIILSSVCVAPVTAQQEDISVVGHPTITDSLTQGDVKQIFLGQKTRWSDGSKIVFVILDDKDICKTFLKEYVGKTYSQYKNYWKKQVFTGKGRMPKTFDIPEELLEFLANTEGAISFVNPETLNSDAVKQLTVSP